MGAISDLLKFILGKSDDDDSDVSVSTPTRSKRLKRGDFCKMISTVGDLKRGSEVMISGVYISNPSYADVVDYKRNYYKIHELHLLKI